MVIIKEKNKGLSASEVLASREKYGENKLQGKKKKTFIKSFFSNLNDPIIRVLIIALIINILVMFPSVNWFECGGIAMSVIIATLVSTISEYSSENTFEKLQREGENKKCIVKRAEGVCEIPIEELVVGDIMLLEAGGGVFADGMLLDGELTLDESALTGESTEVSKSGLGTQDEGKQVLKGSLVCSGKAEAIVTQVGEKTYYGRVAKELGEDSRPSPLKNRLSELAKSISRLGYIFAILIALAYLFNVFFIDSNMVWSETILKLSDTKLLLSECLKALTLAISIVVVAVPEGLPMMITVVLSSNMKKMIKDNVLVKKLVGIETSGNINLLFTDKTGTLTEGKLKLKEIHTLNNEFKSLTDLSSHTALRKYFTLCAKYSSSATYNGKKILGSNATDRAILECVAKEKLFAEEKEKIPFDSAKKYSATIVNFEGTELALFKGAPEKIISSSNTYLDLDGGIKPISNQEKNNLYKKLKKLGDEAYRVVALAIKTENCDTCLKNVTFLCLLAIRDKIRKEVPRAIKSVSEAGVGVVMITGDSIDTARQIAKECGIITPYGKRQGVITREELNNMTDDEISDTLPNLAVVSRALPSDKSRLVRIAQKSGYIVGMTGDGINDASSLKMADVGFGMGSGTEVAKEACDIVISDNNFASIVKAILYGRTIFESIRKFVLFQLTMNLVAVGISLLGPFIGVEAPVTITQMLWVNIIMDTLGALAFACEPPLQEYMKSKPKRPDEKIISGSILKRIISLGVYVISLCVWFLKSEALPMLLLRGDEKYIMSAFFAMFIFTGIFVCFTSRTSRLNIFANLSKNKYFTLIMLGISFVQMIFIYFGGDAFRSTPLFVSDLFKIALLSFSAVPFDFILKLIYKNRNLKKKGRILFDSNKLKEKRNVA